MRLMTSNPVHVDGMENINNIILGTFNDVFAYVQWYDMDTKSVQRKQVDITRVHPVEVAAPVKQRKPLFSYNSPSLVGTPLYDWLRSPDVLASLEMLAELGYSWEEQFRKEHYSAKGYYPDSSRYHLYKDESKGGKQLRIRCLKFPADLQLPHYYKIESGYNTGTETSLPRNLSATRDEWSSNSLCFDLLRDGFDIGTQDKLMQELGYLTKSV